MAEPLPEAQRKEIFLAVDVSRRVVAERFGVSEGQVRQIERDGMDNGWPPLEGPAGP
jgi:hypothetical protein